MNLFFRLFYVWLTGIFRPRLNLLDTSVLHLMVFPNDLDLYGHLNNGRYLTLMDLGRIDLIFRSRLYAEVRRRGWNPLVAGLKIKYRKSLNVFKSFELNTRILGWDEKWFYIEQAFKKDGQVCATATVKGVFKHKARTIPVQEVLESIGFTESSPALTHEILSGF